MGDLIFTIKPALATTSITMIERANHVAELRTKPKDSRYVSEFLATIEQTHLLQSLLKYGDVYACTESPYLNYRIKIPIIMKKIAVLHLVFAEPFNGNETISVIDMWGTGLTKKFAQDNLVKHIENMCDYEDCLLHFYYKLNTPTYTPYFVSPPNQYAYDMYDPYDLYMHKITQDKDLATLRERCDKIACGLIFTDVAIKQTLMEHTKQ